MAAERAPGAFASARRDGGSIVTAEEAGAVFHLEELVQRAQGSGGPYLEFLRRASLSAGIYRLLPGEADRQRPHGEDEIYYVIEGDGVVEIAGERSAVSTGDTIYVARGVEHRFHDYPRGLTLLVLFAPARGSSRPDG
jgi:mannose-6-phosphate isomerase-like protein (cupin superfamily)